VVDHSKDDRRTQPELFARFHSEFNFTVDAAASQANAQLPRFFDRETDGLIQSWRNERVWLNPPYSNLADWIAKCHNEFEQGGAELIVALIPANRTEQPFWHTYVEPYRDCGRGLTTRFIRKRQSFIHPDTGLMGSPLFGVVALIWTRTTLDA